MSIKLIPIVSEKETPYYMRYEALSYPNENGKRTVYMCRDIKCKAKTLTAAKSEATRVLNNLITNHQNIDYKQTTFYITKKEYISNIPMYLPIARKWLYYKRARWANCRRT